LRAAQLPVRTGVFEADIDALVRFAHTFDGYRNYRTFERCAAVYHAGPGSTISTLRNWLFFEFRKIAHTGYGPTDNDGLDEMFEVVEELRALLLDRERSVNSRGDR
jgi:hypothetical protein